MKTKNYPICGAGKLKKRMGKETFEYKGKSITIPDYVTYECAECGEAIVDNASLKESGKRLKDVQHEGVTRRSIRDMSGKEIVKLS